MQLVSKEIEQYCIDHTTKLPGVFDALKAETYSSLSAPHMQVGTLEGRFLETLARLMGAKRVLEVGTFSGFSALAMARALPPDGEVVTCDIDPRPAAVARKYWSQDEHGKKIRLELGPATDTLARLTGPFDMMFIDADKAGYINYWNRGIELVRSGGLIAVDNVLWSGRVLAPKEESDHDIHNFNEHARKDPRVSCVMLPIRDGILLAIKN